MTTAPQKPRKGISLPISALVVVACLAAGGGFVWWTFKNTVQTDTVKLSDSDLADLRNAGQRLQYQGSGGVPINASQYGPGNVRTSPFAPGPQAPAVDSISTSGDVTIIRCGNVVVRVRPKTIPGMTFRQRYWGLLQEPTPPLFTIARRIVHEDSVRTQLAVTPQQLTQITAIVAEPAVRQEFITGLPVTVEDEQKAEAAWKQYIDAARSANTVSQAQLFKTIRAAGETALATARGEYARAQRELTAVITVRQIQAYNSGRSLAVAH
jgi:hypothetical protein